MMRYPQIVIYESDGWIAAQLAALAEDRRWLIRESRQAGASVELLRDDRLSVFLLRLERQLPEELALVRRVHELAPACPIVVVSAVKMESGADRLQTAGLAYDLGATYVLFPPLTGPILEDLVSGLLEANIQAMTGGEACANSLS